MLTSPGSRWVKDFSLKTLLGIEMHRKYFYLSFALVVNFSINKVEYIQAHQRALYSLIHPGCIFIKLTPEIRL